MQTVGISAFYVITILARLLLFTKLVKGMRIHNTDLQDDLQNVTKHILRRVITNG